MKTGIKLFMTVLFLSALFAGFDPCRAGLTDEESGRLRALGLTRATILTLEELQGMKGRSRPPTVTAAEVEKLLAMGLSEELVAAFIKLDALTGERERLPITPDEARQLIELGVSQPTLGLMLKNEIHLARKKPAPIKAGPAPGSKEETTPPLKEEAKTPADQVPETSSEQPPGMEKAPETQPRPGREIVHDANGKKMIVYRSGDTRALELSIETDADGRRHIVYRSGDPTGPEPSMSEREREQMKQAYELLRRIQLQVEIKR